MVRKNNAGFTKFADVIILETPTPLVSSNVSIRQPPPPLKSADVLYGWSLSHKKVEISILVDPARKPILRDTTLILIFFAYFDKKARHNLHLHLL